MAKSNNIPFYDFHYPHREALPFEIIYIPGSSGIKRVDFSKPNRVNFYEIMWLTGGTGTRYIDFKAYPIQPHAVFCLTPGQVHYWNIDSSIDGYVVLFLEEFLHLSPVDEGFLRNLDFFHRIDHDPVICLKGSEAESFQATIDLLMAEYRESQFGRTMALQSLLRMILIQLQRNYPASQRPGAPPAEVTLIDQYQRLIDRHFLTQRSVQEYADLMGVTAGYLTKISKEVTGLPAGTLIRNRIIVEAKRLLAHTNRTVAEICAELQFDDSSYFGRFFKREAGDSPLAFRRNFQRR